MLSLPATHGRGGSVSRRDQNQAYRRATVLTGGTKQEETYRPKRQLLFGREREGGASLREAASLAYLAHFPLLFGRERREGKDSYSRQWRLSMAVFLNRNKQP